MMATQEKAAPLQAERPDQQQHQVESITPEPTTCAYCPEGVDVFQLGAAWVCTDHLAASVSLACAIWPADVTYSKAFESVLM